MTKGNWQQHGGAALPIRSGSLSPVMVGPAAPVVIAVDPPHPGRQPWQEHLASWLRGSPNFRGRETGWSVGPKPRVMLMLAGSPALSSLPTGHRWLFSTCPSQKQNPSAEKQPQSHLPLGFTKCAMQITLPSAELLLEDPEFLTFQEGAQDPCLCEK